MKFWVGVFTTLLVVAPTPVIVTHYETVVRYETVVKEEPRPEQVDTPIADSLVDWDSFDLENECLWAFLLLQEIELTMNNIVTTGDWADMNGGACALMGGDDE